MRVQLRIQTARPENIWFMHNFSQQIIKKTQVSLGRQVSPFYLFSDKIYQSRCLLIKV